MEELGLGDDSTDKKKLAAQKKYIRTLQHPKEKAQIPDSSVFKHFG